MKQVIILSGPSGAGKSTYCLKLWNEREASDHYKIVSADHYFLSEVNGKQVYNFDPSKLGAAHGRCFRQFIEALQTDHNRIIVDNTNTTTEEISPYILGAEAYGAEAEIRTLRCTAEHVRVIAARNIHGVGLAVIENQLRRIESRRLPPWWKNTNIPVEL